MKRLFKKNQIIITSLAIMIAAAGYLNYSGRLFGNDLTESEAELANQELLDISLESGDADIEETPGEAVLTNGEASGIVAGITEVIEIVSVTAMGFVPVLSGLSNGFTVLSMIADGYEAIHNSLQTTTVIENISGTAYLALSSNVKFIYVKGYGSSDSYQVLGYLGNYLYFAVATVSTLDGAVGEHGSLPVISVDLSNSGEVYSAYFNDYTKSVQNYTYYRNNNLSGYVPECLMQYLTLDLFNTVDAYAIPLSSPHITLPTT